MSISGYMRKEDYGKGSYSPTKGRVRQSDQLTTKTSPAKKAYAKPAPSKDKPKSKVPDHLLYGMFRPKGESRLTSPTKGRAPQFGKSR